MGARAKPITRDEDSRRFLARSSRQQAQYEHQHDVIASCCRGLVKCIDELVKPVDPARLLTDVGRRVAELRAGHGLTQEQLAERASVSTRYVQSLEAGTENLTLETIAKLATILKVKPIALFEPPATKKPRPGRPKKNAD